MGKSKTAAWFVRHCGVFSKRDQLAEKLKQYIDIDVFGTCGTKVCPVHDKYKCDKMLNSTYKFYFSFENSLCTDYVTEKVFNVLDKFVVPVVFNGADMKRFLPPKSYIDANDFDNVEDLGIYLKNLSDNLDEYRKYFWWKKHYKVLYGVLFDLGYCDLCKKINVIKIQKKQYYCCGMLFRRACYFDDF